MRYQINLLPPKEANLIDKVIYFSFHYLRYILIITQLVVISVFFYRFKIDQELVDLKDSIRQKAEIIAVSNSLLKDIGGIDVKIRSIKLLLEEQDRLDNMYAYFLATFPADLFLSKLEILDQSIKLEGYTDDVNIVRIYTSRLQKEMKFKEVQVISLKRTETNYSFVITLNDFTLK